MWDENKIGEGKPLIGEDTPRGGPTKELQFQNYLSQLYNCTIFSEGGTKVPGRNRADRRLKGTRTRNGKCYQEDAASNSRLRLDISRG